MLSRGVTLLVLAWILVGVSSIIVALRLLARAIRECRLAVDDYCMLLAVLTELAHVSILNVAQHYGMGDHIWNLSPAGQVQAMKYITIQEGLSVGTPMFGRISFAVFLLMLLGPTAWIKRCILWSIVGVQVVINVVTIVQIYAQCGSHPSALWDPRVAAVAHCQSPEVETIIGYVQSALNSFSDLVLTILPSIIVWELNLPRKTKTALCVVLGFSVFALVASIMKAVEIKNLSYRNDFTYNMVILQICSVVENNVVIIAASIPKLRALWHKHTPQYRYRSSNTIFGTGGSRSLPPAASYPLTDHGSEHEVQDSEDGVKDGKSDENMFEQPEVEGIMKTVDVEVASNGSSVSSLGGIEKSSREQRDVVPEFLKQSRDGTDRDSGTAVKRGDSNPSGDDM